METFTIPISVPKGIFSAIKSGYGRCKLEQEFKIPQADARFYLRLLEEYSASARDCALILSDLHIPYHHEPSLELAVSFGEFLHPSKVIILGDGFDFYGISKWKKDPMRMPFRDEVFRCREEIQKLSTRFPHAEKVYIAGNHELRLRDFLWSDAKELCGLEEVEVKKLLKLDESGWRYIDNKELMEHGKNPYMINDIVLLHGHEVRSFAQANIPRSYFQKVKCSLLMAHVHQTQMHFPRVLHEYKQCHSLGCLSELNPPFATFNEWNHGFGVIWYDKTSAIIENKRIVNGEIL